MKNFEQVPESPFHEGEQAIQTRLGVREQMEAFGRRVIRSYLPQQHRDFYRQLPYLLVGSLDGTGRPWASILCGKPGFVQSPDETSLTLRTAPLPGDPLEFNLAAGSPIGILGIELETRRRNRASTLVRRSRVDAIELGLVQSFGNCPQYIQAREFELLEEHQSGPVIATSALNQEMAVMIGASDTFFVASTSGAAKHHAGQASEGADVSHRGGRPGFVRVDETGGLWVPDYPGNNHFNTLGNFEQYPRAGLLFPDFETGDLLSLTGSVEVSWNSEEAAYFEGAQRFWRFQPERCLLLKDVLPLRSAGVEPSPNTGLTGTWEEAARRRQVEAMKDSWVKATVVKTVDEGGAVRSFYLSPDLPAKPDFVAGQFLPVRGNPGGTSLQRTYTLSSGPLDDVYRISVKRDGEFSSFLHDKVQEGDRVEIRAPAGEFVLSEARRPLLLIGAGVGITPMVSMARQLLADLLRFREMRSVTLLAVARTTRDKAFEQELSRLAQASGGRLRVHWCLTRPEEGTLAGSDYQFSGRPDRAMLDQLLPAEGSEAYLCGPAPFMQESYSILRELGVPDENIFAEAFGPAALRREGKVDEDVAESAVVSFVDERGELLIEQGWEKRDGSLLEFAESHGINPEFSCRSGQCGTCRATLLTGDVVHSTSGSTTGSDGVLLCSARPRKGGDSIRIAVSASPGG